MIRSRGCTYIAATLLSFTLITGCSTTSQLIETGDIQIGMTLEDFESVMFWGSDVDSDPGMESHGGSGYGNDNIFHGYRLAYGGNQEKVFVFDRRSVLVAITDNIGGAKQLILKRGISDSRGQQQMRSSAGTSRRSTDTFRVHGNKADYDICYMIAENADPKGTYLAEAKLRRLGCADRLASGEAMGGPKPASKSTDPLTNDEIQELLDLLKNVERRVEDQDTEGPVIQIISVKSDGPRGIVSGVVIDDSGVAELAVNGSKIVFEEDGRFKYPTYVPNEGLDVAIRAVDFTGLVTTESVRLERTGNDLKTSSLTPVNPLIGPKQKTARHRAALIIGVENYEASAPAQFASRDAQMFADYAREKLGIPASNVKVLTDSEASEREILTALKVWLPTAVKPDKTDLYVFYAGHGMPTADGSTAYLVPYDGDVRLLEDTAISRKRFFDEIGDARPRSATFFFDNCYSGATRSEQLLLAARPLTIKVDETDVPDNFLVFAAGETDQIAGVEPEVKHGRFSYFVFKGLEGEADANSDEKISAGELHAYVRESVGRFSAGAQTPTMLGDAGKWVLQ
ncbi:MAG: caspase family protein [Pseudomonadota bacterium]|nr:caspase family protein [Pseudomonadota bacterium]